MGGIGSGKWGCRTQRKTTADYPLIDVRALERAGLLVQGSRFTATLTTGDQLRGRVTRKRLEAKVGAGCITLGDSTVRVVRLRCTTGGWRSFFVCARCECRKCLLYFCGGFGCRACLRLAYPVEREAAGRRAIRRAARIIRRANAAGLSGFPSLRGRRRGKPSWMRWPTFERLEREANEAAAVIARKESRVHDLLRQADAPSRKRGRPRKP